MRKLTLYIGTKNTSSWSFRAWLGLRHLQLEFEEKIISLGQPDTAYNIELISPSGTVPCLHIDDLKIWDSLAILEYANEISIDKKIFPKSLALRGLARSIISEIHSSLHALRTECPMNIKKKGSLSLSPAAIGDLKRIYDIWDQCKEVSPQTPFLLGEFSIADIFFAPIISRIITYDLPHENHSDYITTISNLTLYKEWEQSAIAAI